MRFLLSFGIVETNRAFMNVFHYDGFKSSTCFSFIIKFGSSRYHYQANRAILSVFQDYDGFKSNACVFYYYSVWFLRLLIARQMSGVLALWRSSCLAWFTARQWLLWVINIFYCKVNWNWPACDYQGKFVWPVCVVRGNRGGLIYGRQCWLWSWLPICEA